MRAKDGGYAALVFFVNGEDAERGAEMEQASRECLEFFSIMEPDRELTDMGVSSFEHVKTYDRR